MLRDLRGVWWKGQIDRSLWSLLIAYDIGIRWKIEQVLIVIVFFVVLSTILSIDQVLRQSFFVVCIATILKESSVVAILHSIYAICLFDLCKELVMMLRCRIDAHWHILNQVVSRN